MVATRFTTVPQPQHTHHTHLYRVCWASIVGDGEGQGRPMVRELAEFVVHDEELAHPMRRYWVEPCADQEAEDE